jgi:membrane protein implicated in regulation of membrane protease activity
MTVVVAILLAVFHVVRGWLAFGLVAAALTFELSQNVYWLWYSQRRAAQVGAEALFGRIAEVAQECRPLGTVRVQGELWQARCPAGAAPGERVRITGLDGLTLEVEPDD